MARGRLFGRKIFGAWVHDYVLAFSLGIAFQYFTIKPMLFGFATSYPVNWLLLKRRVEEAL